MTLLLTIAASAIIVGSEQPPSPQGAPSEIQVKHLLSSAEMFDLADRAFRAGNVAVAETILLALARNPDSKLRNEARFRLAMLYRSSGRKREAALMLRWILDEEPTAGRVRLELAATLQDLGDSAAARRELRALRSVQLPPGVARFVDRFAASLQADKPLGFFAEVALAPDSNVARATGHDTLHTVIGEFDIVDDGRKRSGVGLAMRGLLTGRLPVKEKIDLTAQVSARANLYRDPDFNNVSIELAAGPEITLGKTHLSIDGAIGQSWYGSEPYQRNVRLSLGAKHPIGSVSQLRIDTSLSLIDNQVNDLQDGLSLGSLARFETAISPRLLLSADASVARLQLRDDAYSNWSWNLGLSAYREAGRMTLIGGVNYGELEADERLVLLPRARRDRLIRTNFGVVLRQINFLGISPLARVVFERSRSTVEFYDYSRTRAEIGFSRAF